MFNTIIRAVLYALIYTLTRRAANDLYSVAKKQQKGSKTSDQRLKNERPKQTRLPSRARTDGRYSLRKNTKQQ